MATPVPFDTESVRPAAVAGRFYPADATELRGLVESLIGQAAPVKGPVPKAIIAPHAGYAYSGPIAASAYAQLLPAREQIRRIVLLGPAHYVPLNGIAASSVEAFATPLGVVPIDLAAVRQVLMLPQARVSDEAHAQEHCLEVQLPFLQAVLSEFTLVPLLVGEAAAEEVSQLLEVLWGGPETRFVISSDLSHYHDSETARGLDQATARAIETLMPDDIGQEGACGRIPICGLLDAARRHRLCAHSLDLRNSGDTAGPRDRVVGYGAFAFEES